MGSNLGKPMKKHNHIYLRNKGKFVCVNDEDFDWLNQWTWCFHKGYAVRGGKKLIYMHREINNTPDNLFTDHINHNKLDNQRENLRTVTTKQNCQNTLWFDGIVWLFKPARDRWVTFVKLVIVYIWSQAIMFGLIIILRGV